MWKIVLLAVIALATARKVSYENYKVYRVIPSTEEQLKILQDLEDGTDGYSFWAGVSLIGKPADVMVAPHKDAEFHEVMGKLGITYEHFVDNVQTLINSEQVLVQTPSQTGFKFDRYYTLEEIYAYLDTLAKTYPDKVEVVVGGKSYEGRELKGVKVSFGKTEKPGIFIEGGIHAREWISPATVTYILTQLLESADKEVRELAESHDWYIFPVFNPDGYVYTHTKDRLWRKTRKPYSIFCYGADPNRNWGYKWNQGGASDRPCSETFAGSAPFSDIEIKTISDYLTSISDKFYAYISFHSYSQLLLFPYGHTTEHLDNYDESYAIGKKTIEALAKRYGTQYTTGNIAEAIYIATGASVDWVKGTLKKPIAYTYELRDRGRHGFLLPADQIVPTGEETLDSIISMFKEAKARGYPK